jgi:hypothetical protein
MTITYTKHALARMAERGISLLHFVLESAQLKKVFYDTH